MRWCGRCRNHLMRSTGGLAGGHGFHTVLEGRPFGGQGLAGGPAVWKPAGGRWGRP